MYNTIRCTLDTGHNKNTVTVIELCHSTNASHFENTQINFVFPMEGGQYDSCMALLSDKVQEILLILFWRKTVYMQIYMLFNILLSPSYWSCMLDAFKLNLTKILRYVRSYLSIGTKELVKEILCCWILNLSQLKLKCVACIKYPGKTNLWRQKYISSCQRLGMGTRSDFKWAGCIFWRWRKWQKIGFW